MQILDELTKDAQLLKEREKSRRKVLHPESIKLVTSGS